MRSTHCLTTALAALAFAGTAAAQNDDCAGAIALAANTPTPFDTTAATTSTPAWPCAAGGNDIWFAYTPATSGLATVDTCGSGYDSALEAFSGTCAALVSLACNDDFCGLQSTLTFNATAGTTYLIRVGGFASATGTGTITVTQAGPAAVTQGVGLPPNATGVLDFDNPFVASGLIAGNASTFTNFGISNVTLVGSWTAAGDTMTNGSNVVGQGLVSQGGQLAIAGPGQPLDNCSAASGYEFTLAAPATEFGCLFVDQINWNYTVEIFLGATSLGVGNFSYSGNFPAPAHYWTSGVGAFDRIRITSDPANGGWGVDSIAFNSGTPTLGTNYCTANANSTGATAHISASGSLSVAMNNLTLEASDLPNNAFGFFLTSTTQATTPNPGGSQGILCLGGSIGRYVGPGQIKNSGGAGAFDLLVDLTQVPTPTGFVAAMAGQSRNFQAWYRDSVGGSATSNFTEGLNVVFQ